jgi:hypothetical protein
MFLDLGLGKEVHFLILVSPLAYSKLWWNHRARSNCIYITFDIISGGNMVLTNCIYITFDIISGGNMVLTNCMYITFDIISGGNMVLPNCIYITFDIISGGNMVLPSHSQTCYILMHVF